MFIGTEAGRNIFLVLLEEEEEDLVMVACITGVLYFALVVVVVSRKVKVNCYKLKSTFPNFKLQYDG
jgi:hypothetical protein